jgi:hypothetical protein
LAAMLKEGCERRKAIWSKTKPTLMAQLEAVGKKSEIISDEGAQKPALTDEIQALPTPVWLDAHISEEDANGLAWKSVVIRLIKKRDKELARILRDYPLRLLEKSVKLHTGNEDEYFELKHVIEILDPKPVKPRTGK